MNWRRHRPRFRLLSLMVLVAIIAVGIAGRRTPELWRQSRVWAKVEAEYFDRARIALASGDAHEAALMRRLASWARGRKVRSGRAATHFWEPGPGEVPIVPLPWNRKS